MTPAWTIAGRRRSADRLPLAPNVFLGGNYLSGAELLILHNHIVRATLNDADG